MQFVVVKSDLQKKYSKRNHVAYAHRKSNLCHELWQNASNLWIFDLFQRLSGWLSKSRNKWSASASICTRTVTWPVPNSLYIANCLFTHWKDIVSLVRAKLPVWLTDVQKSSRVPAESSVKVTTGHKRGGRLLIKIKIYYPQSHTGHYRCIDLQI